MPLPLAPPLAPFGVPLGLLSLAEDCSCPSGVRSSVYLVVGLGPNLAFSSIGGSGPSAVP
eukprot:12899117-Prorocentrum_lima.AAC.1